MFALRNTRSLHAGPHPAPLRGVICSPVFRSLLLACDTPATCLRAKHYDSYGNNLEDEIWHMASFKPATTGLPMWILLSPEYPPLDQPRMLVRKECGRRKVWQGDDFPYFTVTVEEEPQGVEQNTGSIQQADIELVKQYIKLNFDAIVRFWKDDDIDEVCKTLKPLQNSGTATNEAVPAE